MTCETCIEDADPEPSEAKFECLKCNELVCAWHARDHDLWCIGEQ